MIGPLLVWSLWLIDEVGPDLIAARREWRPLFMVIARPSSQQRLAPDLSGPGFLGDGATWSPGFQAPAGLVPGRKVGHCRQWPRWRQPVSSWTGKSAGAAMDGPRAKPIGSKTQ